MLMAPQNSNHSQPDHIHQPLTPEEVDPQQKHEHVEAMRNENPTVNPGDRIDAPKDLEEKAQQVAVDVADITGDNVVVPTYFVTDEPDGGHRALHHVRDAEEISDVVRQARVNEDGERTWW